MVSSDQGSSRLIVHHLRMRQNLQPRFWRFHLQIAENQLIFLVFHLADRFSGCGRRIHAVAPGFEDCLESQPGCKVVVHNEYSCQF